MKITEDMVKGLLEKLISPSYPELIDDYMVDIRTLSDGWTLIGVGVIVHPEKYYEMDDNIGSPFRGLDNKIEREVKDVLKYLGPSQKMVSIYVVDDEWTELSELMGKFLKSDYTPERYRESLGVRSKRYKVVSKDNNTIVIETDADADLLNCELKDNVMDYLSNNMNLNPDWQIIFKSRSSSRTAAICCIAHTIRK
jgi:hypothetical protein